jgi:hypothetical protein
LSGVNRTKKTYKNRIQILCMRRDMQGLVTSLSFTHRPHAVREFVITKTFYYCSYKLWFMYGARKFAGRKSLSSLREIYDVLPYFLPLTSNRRVQKINCIYKYIYKLTRVILLLLLFFVFFFSLQVLLYNILARKYYTVLK